MTTKAGLGEEAGKRAAEAASWFLRLREDDVPESELSEWLRWCADSRNLSEFQQIRATWRGFEQLGPAASEMLEMLLEDRDGDSSFQDEHKGPRRSAAVSKSRWRQARWPAMAASLVAVTVAAFVYHGWQHGAARTQPIVHHEPATVRSTILPDGSALTLAPSTEVAVNFNEGIRKLELSHGEAYFDVKPDPVHPFVVQTASLRVTAVGTAFDVRSRAGRVIVTVEEGVVEVARLDSDASAGAWRVAAGYQISYDAKYNAARIVAVDAEYALGWREGRLEYFAEPLADVAADVSRYAQRSIEIGDPQAGAWSFTGTVFVGNVDDWLSALEATFPVQVVRQNDHVILQSRESD